MNPTRPAQPPPGPPAEHGDGQHAGSDERAEPLEAADTDDEYEPL